MKPPPPNRAGAPPSTLPQTPAQTATTATQQTPIISLRSSHCGSCQLGRLLMSSPLPRPIDSQCRFIENRRYEDMSMASGATTGRAVHGASRAGTSDTVGVHGRFLVKMKLVRGGGRVIAGGMAEMKEGGGGGGGRRFLFPFYLDKIMGEKNYAL